LFVLVRWIVNNGNDMMDVIHSNDEHYLFLDLMKVTTIRVSVDEVDIENKKNHFVLEEEELLEV
jgi:hypothetical protein